MRAPESPLTARPDRGALQQHLTAAGCGPAMLEPCRRLLDGWLGVQYAQQLDEAPNAGKAYLLSGGSALTAETPGAAAQAICYGTVEKGHLLLMDALDIDGDGLWDIVVGQSDDGGLGKERLFLIMGEVGMSGTDSVPSWARASFSGTTVSDIETHDTDQDGLPDLVVGAAEWSEDADNAGVVWIFPGDSGL